jgi:hypothetical protein
MNGEYSVSGPADPACDDPYLDVDAEKTTEPYCGWVIQKEDIVTTRT